MRRSLFLLLLPFLLFSQLAFAGDRAAIDPRVDPTGLPSYVLPDTQHRAPLDSAQLYNTIESARINYNIPGVAASVMKFGEVVWSSSHGFADTEQGIAVTDSTSFMLASISKTFVGVALMQLVEDGLLDLDRDIDAYLPFDVDNPYHPSAPISARMILAHTSSISVKNTTWLSMIVDGQDSPIGLHEFLSEYLVSGGTLYVVDNYTPYLPGIAGEYSNVGYTLAGYLLEVITGQTLETYCQQNIFGPLGMTETSWFLSPLQLDQIAMPTAYHGGAFVPYGQYGFPTFPCGQLRTSLRQLSRYLQMFMNRGEIDGIRILEASTVDQMMEIQYPDTEVFPNYDWGLGWVRIPAETSHVWGHTGGLYGVSTFMFFHPTEDFGIIELTNGDATEGHGQILDALYLYARDLEPLVPVLVSGLHAQRQDDGSARVSWSVPGSTVGPRFHVWRETHVGQRERISGMPIEAEVDGACSYVDLAAPRTSTTYWLEMLEDQNSGEDPGRAASSWVGSVSLAAADPLTTLVSLRGSYPNPFHEETALFFETSRPSEVRVEVYDLRGRRVKTLIDERLPAGSYRPVWRGEDAAGNPVSVGTYLYRVQADQRVLTEKVMRQ